MAALMDPGNLLLLSLSSLAEPFPLPCLCPGQGEASWLCLCTGARAASIPRGSCLCRSSVGPVPPSQGPAQLVWVSVGTAGWDSPRAGREAPGLELLPSCCGWMCGCHPPVSAR